MRDFRRIGHLDAADTALLQFPAHDLGQGIDAGLFDVIELEIFRMELIPGPHGGHDGDAAVIGFVDDGDFGAHRIDGIDDVIGPGMGDEALMAFRQIERRMGLDVDVGIDGQEAFLHDFDFRPANGLDRRPELAVDIGRVEDVGIDQDEMAHTGPAQGFDDSRADAADAEDEDLFRI